MIRAFAILSLTALTGCGANLYAQQTSPGYVKPEPRFAAGTKRWAEHSFQLCAEPKVLGAPCKIVPANTEMTIERSTRGDIRDYYFAHAANGTEGWAPELDFAVSTRTEKEQAAKVAEKAACERKGGVAIGMTAEQVRASCWGRPARVNTTMTGVSRHEQWVYGSDYVYLRDGVVTSIQTTRY